MPLAIYPHKPLTFAITHIIHQSQMRTGWPRRPIMLRDRVDADDNILVEAQASNFMKPYFHESFYPKLKSVVLGIRMPRQWVDESITPRAFDARLKELHFKDAGDGFTNDDYLEDDDLGDNLNVNLDVTLG